jgi:hypothetical protein
MSDLEVAAKPALIDLMTDPSTPRILEQGTLAIIGRWIAKTMLMFQFVNRDGPKVPSTLYPSLHEDTQPLPGFNIWLAALHGAPGYLYRHHRLNLEKPVSGEQAHGNIATFGIRHLAFQVFGHTFPPGVAYSRPDEHRYLVPVWPLEGSQVWPPELPFTYTGWQTFADSPITQ